MSLLILAFHLIITGIFFKRGRDFKDFFLTLIHRVRDSCLKLAFIAWASTTSVCWFVVLLVMPCQ